MGTVNIRAYAKVNFILDILGTRTDGYHEVESFMQAIDLYDDVALTFEEDCGSFVIYLDPGRDDLPSDSRNLAFRAAELIHSRFCPDKKGLLKVKIVKRIPVAAGLAGGSADAAAVINGLAALWNIKDEDGLLAAAGSLGADVPFCLMAQRGIPAAVARGTGTELTPARPADCTLVLSTPPVPVPTKAVYGELKDSDCLRRSSVKNFEKSDKTADKVMFMGNHLQAPALRLFSAIEPVLKAHGELGGLRTQLSGSGPTVFTVFEKGMAPQVCPRVPEGTEINICDTLVK